MMRRSSLLALVALAGCTNSLVETGETWTRPTAAQAAAFRANLPGTVNPYILERRAPNMGRDGCAKSVSKKDGVLIVEDPHPIETVCIAVAPYSSTILELAPGVRLVDSTASVPHVLIKSAFDGDHDILTLTSTCVPVRKDAAGNFEPSPLYTEGNVDEQALPKCPGISPRSDLTLVTSAGLAKFRVALNNTTHDSHIIMGEAKPLAARSVNIPARPPFAQDLQVTSEDGAMVPWTPDEAWCTGTECVIIWERSMPTLPQFRMGPEGEQSAAPLVVNRQGRIAMIIAGVDFFQLRMDDRILSFALPTAKVARVNPRPEPWQ